VSDTYLERERQEHAIRTGRDLPTCDNCKCLLDENGECLECDPVCPRCDGAPVKGHVDGVTIEVCPECMGYLLWVEDLESGVPHA
jgi:Transcription factor zinc-finger